MFNENDHLLSLESLAVSPLRSMKVWDEWSRNKGSVKKDYFLSA